MFKWLFSNKYKKLEEKIHEGFSNVKNDIDSMVKWIKHLNKKDKQLFDLIFTIKEELSSIRDETSSLRESLDIMSEERKNKQSFKKLPIFDKQTTVYDDEKVVQTVVQTDNLYGILKRLSSNERLLVFTLLNSDLKLSYEDLALLLGKERSTIRGQINSVKQKCEGLIQEMSEKNGKKRVFIDEETKKKMQKYAKVRSREKS